MPQESSSWIATLGEKRRTNPAQVADRAMMRTLMEVHAALVPQRGGIPAYDIPRLVHCGVVYVHVWHVLPTTNRLRSQYYMPDYTTILRFFGSLAAYHAAIIHAVHAQDGLDEKGVV